MVLMPSAAIVFGGTLVFSSGISARLDEMLIGRMGEEEVFKDVAREAVSASAGVSLLFGVVAITLGILALVGINPVILNLVALLGVGLSNLLSGTAISTRMLYSYPSTRVITRIGDLLVLLKPGLSKDIHRLFCIAFGSEGKNTQSQRTLRRRYLRQSLQNEQE
jgi:hypothetical protein